MTIMARSGRRWAFTPPATTRQRVDIQAGVGLVQDGQRRLENRHLQGLVALLLTAGEPLVDRAAHEAAVHLDQLHPLLGQGQELRHIERVEAPAVPQRVEGGAQKVQVADPGDLDRVLEGQEDAGGGAVLGRQGQQVLPLEGHRSGDVVGVVAGQDVGQGALTRPVRAHDGVHFAGADLEVDAAENLMLADAGVKVSDVQHHPTLPSRLTLRSRWRLDRELHRQLLEHLAAEAVDDHGHRVLFGDPPLAAVEQLVLADLRRRRLVFDLGGGVLHLDVRERVGAAVGAEQQRVAAGVVPGSLGRAQHLDQPPVGVLAVPGRDRLRDDGAAGVLADMDHLGAGVGLLTVGGERHRVELPHRVVALQDHARVLPGDRRTGLDLGPGDLGVRPGALSSLGDEVVDTAAAVGVARIPVLDRRVLDTGPFERHQLDDRGVELVLVAHGCRATLEVADVRALLGDDEGPLELACPRRVDTEVRGQLHRAVHALGDEAERPVGEHRRVEGREKVVPVGHHRPQVRRVPGQGGPVPPRRTNRR